MPSGRLKALVRSDTSEVVEVFPANQSSIELPGYGSVKPLIGSSYGYFYFCDVVEVDVPDGWEIVGEPTYEKRVEGFVLQHAHVAKPVE